MSAFEDFYRRHHGGVRSFCRRILRSADDAEDAAQQTFLSAYADLADGVQPDHPKAWLYGIARNRCRETLRSRHRSSSLVEKSSTNMAEEIERRADVRELFEDLKELPHEQRMALALFGLGELSHADIAGVLDCKPARVKALVFQARSALRADREAREIPCHEIRELLATQPGSALRGRALRLHVRCCRGCTDFYHAIRHQPEGIASVLLPTPTLALKEKLLAAIGHWKPGAAADASATLLSQAATAKLALVLMVVSGVAMGDRVILGGSDASGGDRSLPVLPSPRASPTLTSTPRGMIERESSPPQVRAWADPPSVSIWQPLMRRERELPGRSAGDPVVTGEVDGAAERRDASGKLKKGGRGRHAGPAQGRNAHSGRDGGVSGSAPGERHRRAGDQPSQRTAGDRSPKRKEPGRGGPPPSHGNAEVPALGQPSHRPPLGPFEPAPPPLPGIPSLP